MIVQLLQATSPPHVCDSATAAAAAARTNVDYRAAPLPSRVVIANQHNPNRVALVRYTYAESGGLYLLIHGTYAIYDMEEFCRRRKTTTQLCDRQRAGLHRRQK